MGETVNIGITNSAISFTVNGAPMSVSVLPSQVTFSPTALETFSLSGNSWATTAPTDDAISGSEVG